MRYAWLALAVLLLGGMTAAQQTNQPQAPAERPASFDPARDPLDSLLLRWEQAMNKVNNLSVQCTRITDDKTFQVRETFEGVAMYMKPDKAKLRMNKQGKPEVEERFIYTGAFLYAFDQGSKEVRAYPVTPPKAGQSNDDNVLALVLGMKAEEAKRRYVLQLDKPEDPYYYYINIWPRLQADKQEFQRAQLVLEKNSYLVKQLWFEAPNKNTVLWMMSKAEVNGAMNIREFDKPEPPPGWKVKVMPRQQEQPQPRIIRPNGQ